jgi:hypothetical protein
VEQETTEHDLFAQRGTELRSGPEAHHQRQVAAQRAIA